MGSDRPTVPTQGEHDAALLAAALAVTKAAAEALGAIREAVSEIQETADDGLHYRMDIPKICTAIENVRAIARGGKDTLDEDLRIRLALVGDLAGHYFPACRPVNGRQHHAATPQAAIIDFAHEWSVGVLAGLDLAREWFSDAGQRAERGRELCVGAASHLSGEDFLYHGTAVWRIFVEFERHVGEGRPPKTWVGVREAARPFDLTPSTVTRLCDAGKIRSHGRGRERRVDPMSVFDYVRTQLRAAERDETDEAVERKFVRPERQRKR